MGRQNNIVDGVAGFTSRALTPKVTSWDVQFIASMSNLVEQELCRRRLGFRGIDCPNFSRDVTKKDKALLTVRVATLCAPVKGANRNSFFAGLFNPSFRRDREV